jgi:hypothetical protein
MDANLGGLMVPSQTIQIKLAPNNGRKIMWIGKTLQTIRMNFNSKYWKNLMGEDDDILPPDNLFFF